MATVVFDFDSTLITCESLEEIYREKQVASEVLDQIKEITAQGMSGTISFLTSLQKRLSLAAVTRKDFEAFGTHAEEFLTPGMKELVRELKGQSVDVWVVSGAVRYAMAPLIKQLGIPEGHLLGIDLLWTPEGQYAGIDETKPINRSKWEGARQIASRWSAPKIAVGDGITDFALYEHGLVDHFIAFTQNVRRQAVIDKGVPEAKNLNELHQILNKLIYGNAFLSEK